MLIYHYSQICFPRKTSVYHLRIHFTDLMMKTMRRKQLLSILLTWYKSHWSQHRNFPLALVSAGLEHFKKKIYDLKRQWKTAIRKYGGKETIWLGKILDLIFKIFYFLRGGYPFCIVSVSYYYYLYIIITGGACLTRDSYVFRAHLLLLFIGAVCWDQQSSGHLLRQTNLSLSGCHCSPEWRGHIEGTSM